jgi:hypothetical protein
MKSYKVSRKEIMSQEENNRALKKDQMVMAELKSTITVVLKSWWS